MACSFTILIAYEGMDAPPAPPINATFLRFGTISFSSSICLGSKPNQATPVTFPPGHARLVMKRSRAGSHPPSIPSPTCALVLEWARWPHLMCVVGTETFIHLRRQCLCDLHILTSVLLDRNRNVIACGKCPPKGFIQHIFDMGSWRRGRWISRHGVAPCKAMTRPMRCRRRKRKGRQTGARKTVPVPAVKEPISISGEPTAERRPTKLSASD